MKIAIFLLSVSFIVSSCKSSNDHTNSSPSETEDTVAKVPALVEDLSSHPGYALYMKHCLPCHQADGNGVPGMYPTLQNTKWVNGDNETLISIVVHGMNEEIEVDGEPFKLPMAALPHLNDQEVADVLNFVRKKFGSSELTISAGDVAIVRSNS